MSLRDDIRLAVRGLMRTPGITAAALVSIAVGIAANASVFTLVNAVLFKPMPVPHPEQLVALYTTEPDQAFPSSFSYPDYRDYRDNNQVFSDLFVHANSSISFGYGGQKAQLIWGEIVSGNYFRGLGLTPTIGRFLAPADDIGDGAHPVAVLSYTFWQRRFGGDTGIVGKVVTLTGHDFTVIGVAPKGFSGTRLAGFIPDVWVPVSMRLQLRPGLDDPLKNRADSTFNVNGRLRPGITLSQATAAMNVIAERLARTYPQTNARKRVGMVPAGGKTQPAIALLGYVPMAASVMLAVVVLVLVIACANVANLLLARASERRREIALRLALGARPQLVVRQLLTESVLLSLAAGVAGLALARWFTALVPLFTPTFDFATFDFDYALGVDYRILAFTTALSVAAGIVFGLVPALQASKTDMAATLHSYRAEATNSLRRFSLRSGLVVAQVALSLALLTGAGVFVRSMRAAEHIDPGFEAKNVVLASVDAGVSGYSEAAGRRFFKDAVDRVKALPGVQAASIAGPLPLDSYDTGEQVTPEGYVPRDENERIVVGYSVVGPDYFTAMSTRLVAGRGFTENDRVDTAPVVIVNETFASRFWRGQSAIGKRVRIGGENRVIVGVARDGKYLLLGEPATSYMFLPHTQHYAGTMTVIARTAGPPERMLSSVRRALEQLDPQLPVYGVKTMPMFLDRLLSMPASVAALFSLFAVLAVMMSALGLYGVLNYAIARQTKEIGVRVAIGAGRASVMWLVMKHGLALVLVGMAIGVVAALGLLRFTASLLYGVGPNDPVTFVAIAFVLMVVALAACYVPARRAIRVDPVVALRAE